MSGDVKCPLSCSYCFALQPNYVPQDTVDAALKEAATFGKNSSLLVQPCCDSEIFARPDDGMKILFLLSELGHSISISTKMALSDHMIRGLAEINGRLDKIGALLSVTISIPKIYNLRKYELGTCSIDDRIINLEKLAREGIHTVSAIRPVLPDLSAKEAKDIVDVCRPWCSNFVDGPFYTRRSKYLKSHAAQERTTKIEWLSNDRKDWLVIDNAATRLALKEYILDHPELRFFDGNIQAVEAALSSKTCPLKSS